MVKAEEGSSKEREIAPETEVLNICFSMDVGRSMFNVRRSSVETRRCGSERTATLRVGD
jgi:hypothetical protein